MRGESGSSDTVVVAYIDLSKCRFCF